MSADAIDITVENRKVICRIDIRETDVQKRT